MSDNKGFQQQDKQDVDLPPEKEKASDVIGSVASDEFDTNAVTDVDTNAVTDVNTDTSLDTDVSADDNICKEEIDKLLLEKAIEVDCTFNGSETKKALFSFFVHTQMKKNIIVSMIAVLLVGANYFHMFASGGTNDVTNFVTMLGVLFVVCLWVNPMMYRKKVAQSAEEIQQQFKVRFYPVGIMVSNGEGTEFVLHYDSEISMVIELDDMILFCAGSERVFIITYRCVGDKKDEIIEMAKQNSKRYIK